MGGVEGGFCPPVRHHRLNTKRLSQFTRNAHSIISKDSLHITSDLLLNQRRMTQKGGGGLYSTVGGRKLTMVMMMMIYERKHSLQQFNTS